MCNHYLWKSVGDLTPLGPNPGTHIMSVGLIMGLPPLKYFILPNRVPMRQPLPTVPSPSPLAFPNLLSVSMESPILVSHWNGNTICDLLVVSTLWLLWTVLPETLVIKYLFECLFSVLFGTYLGRNAESDGNPICLTFGGTTKLFSTGSTLFYSSASKVQGFRFLHILTNTAFYRILKIYKQPSGCEEVSLYDFWLAFLS